VIELSQALERKLDEISAVSCPSGGNHQPAIEKKEEYADGTVKYIISCKKCRAHFELEVSASLLPQTTCFSHQIRSNL